MTFIGLYTILDYYTAGARFRQIRTVNCTLRITYITRIAISIIFPIAFYLDLVCGVAVIGLMEASGGDFNVGGKPSVGFLATYVTTLMQGLAMNLVLAVYRSLVHLIQWLFLTVHRSRRRRSLQDREPCRRQAPVISRSSNFTLQ